ETLGAPLCPCRHYENKELEVKNGYWNCPCVPMRERHECHCMLFLKDDNPFASLGTGSVPKVKVGVVGVVPGTKDGRILLFYKCPCQVQAKLVQFLWKSWSTWRTGPFLFFWCR
ncbi:unnamed protein product, partial [Durusdinium trenchii]